MKKRLAKLTALAIFLFCLGYLANPGKTFAQTPVTVQPSQQVLAPAGTACTGSVQKFNVNNRNQTQHNVYVVTSGVTSLVVQMYGIDSAANAFLISDTGTIGAPAQGSNPILSANGYFPQIQVQVTCNPSSTGTFILSYSGTSASSAPQIVGGAQLMQEDKTIAQTAPANANLNITFQTPYGNSFGYLNFNYAGGAGPAGSQLQVECLVPSESGATVAFQFLLTTGTPQLIPVPDFACPIVMVAYVSGGATGDTFSLDYDFLQPGAKGFLNYTHITGSTATIVKAGPGVVHTVVVGTPAAGTISLFDLAPANCTATPSTGVVSVITATSTFPAAPEIYDVLFTNGICVKASATMDITISSQ